MFSNIGRKIHVSASRYPQWNRVHQRKFSSTEAAGPSFGRRAYEFIKSRFTLYRIFRAGRVGIIGFGLYSTGFQAGLVNYAQDPHKIEKEMMKGVITATGAESYHPVHHPQHIQVKRVGEKIVFAAKDMCKERIEALTAENAKLKLTVDANFKKTDSQAQAADARKHTFSIKEKIAENDAEIQMFETFLTRLKGSWHYVVIDVPTVNAFVTAACPRRVFVHSGLMEKLKPTDDELALVLGHEISHFLLEHIEKEQSFSTTLKIGTLMLLSFIEPTGMLSLAYDFFLAGMTTFLDASYSRECEEEADTLGIELTARACFDTRKSVQVFKRLSNAMSGSGSGTSTSTNPEDTLIAEAIEEVKTTAGKGRRKASWNDTHPHWDDRIHNVTLLTKDFNSANYRTCQNALRYYIDSIGSIGGLLVGPADKK
jgi:Zn-dependent protease with chaperone function